MADQYSVTRVVFGKRAQKLKAARFSPAILQEIYKSAVSSRKFIDGESDGPGGGR